MSAKLVKPTNQADLLAAAATATGSTGFPADAVAYALKRADDKLTAVAVFDRFSAREADIHFAMLSEIVVTRTMIEAFMLAAFSPHPFCLNLEKVWANIPASKRVVIRAALAVGFEFEHRKRAGFGDTEDAIVLSMSRATPGMVAARPQAMQRAENAQEA
jgi:hypothetical protein